MKVFLASLLFFAGCAGPDRCSLGADCLRRESVAAVKAEQTANHSTESACVEETPCLPRPHDSIAGFFSTHFSGQAFDAAHEEPRRGERDVIVRARPRLTAHRHAIGECNLAPDLVQAVHCRLGAELGGHVIGDDDGSRMIGDVQSLRVAARQAA